MRFDRWENTLGQPYGTVLQVVQTVKNDGFDTTSTSFLDISGLSMGITPNYATSKILVIASINLAQATASDALIRLLRNSSVIGNTSLGLDTTIFGHKSYLTPNEANLQTTYFLDSPSTTSEILYKIQGRVYSGGTLRVNRRANGDFGYTSSITLMEIAQ
jgi:hypothetical protein